METKDLNLLVIYQNLPRHQRVIKRNEVTSKCQVSTHVFYNWLHGKTEIPHLAIPVIEEVFGILENN